MRSLRSADRGGACDRPAGRARHDGMPHYDRVSVMKNGKLMGTVGAEDDILGMVTLGKKPAVALQ